MGLLQTEVRVFDLETIGTTLKLDAGNELRKLLVTRIEKLKCDAESLVAKYWVWVQENNNGLKADQQNGLRLRERQVNFGPRLESRPSGKYVKHVPTWTLYRYSGMRTRSTKSAKYGERIKMNANKEYTLSGLLKYSTVSDRGKIIKTETKLMAIREQLEMYHEMIVSMDSRAKRIERILNKHEEAQNNE